MGPINEADLEWTERDREDYAIRRKKLGAAAGGEDLGCSLYELPPEKRAWPYHYHTANAEAMYVLSGTGRLRLAGEEYPLEPGDYAAFPTGQAGGHQVINPDEGTLRYLMLSTMVDPEVVRYPDSGKVGAFAGAPPGGDGERTVDAFFREDDAVDYWDGE